MKGLVVSYEQSHLKSLTDASGAAAGSNVHMIWEHMMNLLGRFGDGRVKHYSTRSRTRGAEGLPSCEK